MANKTVTVSAKRSDKSKTKDKGECLGVSIQKAENGFTVRCDYATEYDKAYEPTKPHVAESLDGALALAKTALGGEEAAKPAAKKAAKPAMPATEPDGDEGEEEED